MENKKKDQKIAIVFDLRPIYLQVLKIKRKLVQKKWKTVESMCACVPVLRMRGKLTYIIFVYLSSSFYPPYLFVDGQL